jgi:hypothetical protein
MLEPLLCELAHLAFSNAASLESICAFDTLISAPRCSTRSCCKQQHASQCPGCVIHSTRQLQFAVAEHPPREQVGMFETQMVQQMQLPWLIATDMHTRCSRIYMLMLHGQG